MRRPGARASGLATGRPRRATTRASRRNCRAGSSSGSPWRGRWCWSPRCCCSTSRCRNLDARLRRQMREEIRELQQRLGLTVVYVTHDQQEALAVSDRIIVMNAGRSRSRARRASSTSSRPRPSWRASWANPIRRAAACAASMPDRCAYAGRHRDRDRRTSMPRTARPRFAIRPEAITVETAPGARRRADGHDCKGELSWHAHGIFIDTAAGTLFATCPASSGRWPRATGGAPLAPRGVIIVDG